MELLEIVILIQSATNTLIFITLFALWARANGFHERLRTLEDWANETLKQEEAQ